MTEIDQVVANIQRVIGSLNDPGRPYTNAHDGPSHRQAISWAESTARYVTQSFFCSLQMYEGRPRIA